MPFPQREYFTLEQAARRWSVPVEDVRQAIVTGKLTASVWLPPTYAYTITEISESEARRSATQPLEGYVCIAPEACRILFSRGTVARRKFPCRQKSRYYLIVEHLEKATLYRDDLVLLERDLMEFEKLHNLAAQSQCKVISVHKISVKPDQPQQHTHSLIQENDYRYVRTPEHEYSFGDVQAAIVRQICEASFTDNPWRNGKTMLGKAGSTSLIMRDVFRHQPHWKELIHSNKRGYYRLNPTCSPTSALPEPQVSPKQETAMA